MSTTLRWKKSSRSNPNNCVEMAWVWRKSSRSNPNNCVEMAWEWRKSSHSNPTDCVELAQSPAAFALRDSKNPAPTLHFPRPHLPTFLAAIKDS